MANSTIKAMATKAELASVPEIVSNTNGTAYKFPNGLMICTKNVKITAALNSAWGSVYESPKTSLGNWAETFTSKPFISVQSVIDVGSDYNCWIEGITGGGATSIGEVWLIRPVSTTTADYRLNIIGIGKWK